MGTLCIKLLKFFLFYTHEHQKINLIFIKNVLKKTNFSQKYNLKDTMKKTFFLPMLPFGIFLSKHAFTRIFYK